MKFTKVAPNKWAHETPQGTYSIHKFNYGSYWVDCTCKATGATRRLPAKNFNGCNNRIVQFEMQQAQSQQEQMKMAA